VDENMSLFLSFILWLLIGIATAYFANQRGRDPFIWFIVGMFLGLLGLALLFFLPSYSSEGQLSEESEKHVETSPEEPAFSDRSHEYLIKEWFYLDGQRQQQGPMRFEALKSVWGQGRLSIESYVWCDGMENWKKIEELPFLKKALS
jgi:GYF domain 2